MWYNFLSMESRKHINSLYNNMPLLNNIFLSKIEVSRENNQILIGCYIDSKVEKKPKRWLENDDGIYLELVLVSVYDFSINSKGFTGLPSSLNETISIKVTQLEKDLYRVKLTGVIEASIEAELFSIRKISGY